MEIFQKVDMADIRKMLKRFPAASRRAAIARALATNPAHDPFSSTTTDVAPDLESSAASLDVIADWPITACPYRDRVKWLLPAMYQDCIALWAGDSIVQEDMTPAGILQPPPRRNGVRNFPQSRFFIVREGSIGKFIITINR